jgi:hypothetical protein
LGKQLQLDECEPEVPSSGDSGGGDGGGGGSIMVETCYYWANYVNGVLVSTELRYCVIGSIPIAEE